MIGILSEKLSWLLAIHLWMFNWCSEGRNYADSFTKLWISSFNSKKGVRLITSHSFGYCIKLFCVPIRGSQWYFHCNINIQGSFSFSIKWFRKIGCIMIYEDLRMKLINWLVIYCSRCGITLTNGIRNGMLWKIKMKSDFIDYYFIDW